MKKNMLAVALVAAALAPRARPARGTVVIRMRPEAPEVSLVKPLQLNHGDPWRRSGKRRGHHAR